MLRLQVTMTNRSLERSRMTEISAPLIGGKADKTVSELETSRRNRGLAHGLPKSKLILCLAGTSILDSY